MSEPSGVLIHKLIQNRLSSLFQVSATSSYKLHNRILGVKK